VCKKKLAPIINARVVTARRCERAVVTFKSSGSKDLFEKKKQKKNQKKRKKIYRKETGQSLSRELVTSKKRGGGNSDNKRVERVVVDISRYLILRKEK